LEELLWRFTLSHYLGLRLSYSILRKYRNGR
jgi:hypothetical protein